ncbi:MAG: hypothetical protein AAB411_00900 [Patescibacteria group bacterium]
MREESWGEAVVGATVLLLLGYVVISGMSLAAVAAGEKNIPYIEFWHAPWRALILWWLP